MLSDTETSPKPEIVQIPSEPIPEAMFAPESAIPKGFTLSPSLSAAEWSELNSLPKNKLIALAGELKAKANVQNQAISRPHNGDSHNNGNEESSAEEQFWLEMAKSERLARAMRAKDIVSTEKKAESTDFKQFLEFLKVFGTPKQVNELEIWQKATENARKDLETLAKDRAVTETDLKLETLKQSERADMKRMDWELEKWRMDRQEDGRKWELFSKVAEGPLANALSSLGTAGAQRLTRGRKNPQPVKITCPGCRNQVYVDANQNDAVCGFCGVQLSRNAPTTAENSPLPSQTRTPVEEESEEEAPDESEEVK